MDAGHKKDAAVNEINFMLPWIKMRRRMIEYPRPSRRGSNFSTPRSAKGAAGQFSIDFSNVAI
jgi:hypothetical protein